LAAAILSQGFPALTQLDLSSNLIGDRGATRLAEAACGAAALTSLHLISNCIGPVGEEALAAAQLAATRLTDLDLRCRQGPYHASHFCRGPGQRSLELKQARPGSGRDAIVAFACTHLAATG
jgi:hypothetical protein